MRKIQVLDCTLRDGGYCNDCRFGFEKEKRIVSGLLEANIDIIECGFFMNTISYDTNRTRFTSVDQVAKIIPHNREGKSFVVLADQGKFAPAELPEYDGTSIDGFRVAFHKKNRLAGLEDCRKVKEKGYKVFVQAMVSVSYSDEEFLDLIKKVNDIEPYAFYIVDSFGMMKAKDLTRFFYMVEHNLKSEIRIGFHSHNNMQLAYSNAQRLVQIQTNRDLIIDSSVYGMGRGAGNLNTELFTEYLNENAGGTYNLNPLLNIIDDILIGFYHENPWGYSLPNYLSAAHNTHPNYAIYLDDKKTLTVEAMNNIFAMMETEKRLSYDQDYIENLYLHYMASGRVQETHETEIKNILFGKTVLLIAPGKSSLDEQEKIVAFSNRENVITISINHEYAYATTDFIFLSNLRRFRELPLDKHAKCIITSNVQAEGVYLHTKYRDLLTDKDAVRDNAGLMAVKFLMNYGVENIYLAGFDGYAKDPQENYGNIQLAYITSNAILDAMNIGMTDVLKTYSRQVSIAFLTSKKLISN